MREAVNPGSWANRRIIGEVPFAMDLHLTLIRAYERAIHVVTRYFARWGLTPPSVQCHPHPVLRRKRQRATERHRRTVAAASSGCQPTRGQIGRASCRERV